jgi:putative phosphoesterase
MEKTVENKTKKFLIAADFHGSISAFDKVLDLFHQLKADKLLLLGDIFGTDAEEMVNKLNDIADKVVVVRGNNDWYFEPFYAEFKIFDQTYENLNGRTAFLCHGHRLNDMNLGLYGAEIILQGHVHIPFIFKEQGVIRICVGSPARPRRGSEPTVAIADNESIKIINLLGKVIDETTY